MLGGAPQVLAAQGPTQVRAVCDSRARHFPTLAVEGSLLEVCGASHYIRKLRELFVGPHRSAHRVWDLAHTACSPLFFTMAAEAEPQAAQRCSGRTEEKEKKKGKGKGKRKGTQK